MSFASLEFIPFAILFFCFWWMVKGPLLPRYVYLTLLSLAFYGYSYPIYVPLFAFNATVSYLCGKMIASARSRTRAKLTLALGISVDLAVLVSFKYAGFLADNFNWLLTQFGSQTALAVPQLPLPIGISFYTFMSISYLVDVFRQKTQPAKSFLHYSAYLSMFPHLVAGPIVRAHDLLPQLLAPKIPSRVGEGIPLIVRGFFKKLVLADNLAPGVNRAFLSELAVTSSVYWWVVVTMFGLQIYFDFSGYTDIARGLARCLGFEFGLNFANPYSSTSFREFWQRWHISLSEWFRDYVYFPLGGSRGGLSQGMRNMMATMLLSGLWHGANWTYVVWGFLHGFYLALERITNWNNVIARFRGGRLVATLIVFVFVNIAWTFFRATSVTQGAQIVQTMLTLQNLSLREIPDLGFSALFFYVLGLAVLVNHRLQISHGLLERLPFLLVFRTAGYALLASITVFWRGAGGSFIYFQF